MEWNTLLEIALGVSNLLLLAITTSLKADIANVKVYMHEHFVAKE